MNHIFARAALLVLFAASGLAAGAAQYTAVDLYPMPGAGYITPAYDAPIAGAFGGQVVAGSVLWNAGGSASDLAPAGNFAQLNGTDGIHQFGELFLTDPAEGYGALAIPAVWSGSAASVVPLDTTGLIFARVSGIGGGRFVGTGDTVASGLNGNHALLWNSITAQPIDLNPTNLSGFYSCGAAGTDGAQQVGGGLTTVNFNTQAHALLWTGSADSAVDLHPNIQGIFNSYAFATDGQQQVGRGDFYLQGTVSSHALLWNGTADSAVDLNPPGFYSIADAVANGRQVGYGYSPATGNQYNALLWSSTSDSVVNLQQLLTGGFDSSSFAYGIDNAGDVFGVAFNSSDGQYHAIEWIAVPEPGSAGLLLFGCFGLSALRRRRSTVTRNSREDRPSQPRHLI